MKTLSGSRFPHKTVVLAGVLFVVLAIIKTAGAQKPSGRDVYQTQVLPILNRFCADCHSGENSDERWAYDGYEDDSALRSDQQSWRKVQQFVEYHIMPPLGEEAPTAAERQVVLDWIDQTVFYVDPQRPDPGRSGLRRLNRAEYNNTVRDVLGVTTRPADAFPADDAGYGFDNIGDVLSVSSLHFEKYLAAARDIADEMTRLGPPPRLGVELRPEAIAVFAGQPERHDNGIRLLSPEDEVGTTVHVPVASVYRVLIRAASDKRQEQPIPIAVLCDELKIAGLQADGTSFQLVDLPEGEHRITLRAETSSEGNASSADWLANIQFLNIHGPLTPVQRQASHYLVETLGGRALTTPVLRLSGEELSAGSGRTTLDTGRAGFSTNGYRHVPIRLSQSGPYRIRFKVGAQQVGDEPVRFELRYGAQTIGPFEVTANAQAEQWVETRCELEAGERDWQVWFINEHVDAETGAQRWFWLHEFTIEGPLDRDYGLSRSEVCALLQQTGRRLFRRPLTDEETSRLEHLVETALAAGEGPLSALDFGLQALLISPKFLFHPSPRPATDATQPVAPIDELTLASRLSYFLWSSAPDDDLLTLAERGKLRGQLAAQVERMLEDPRSRALTDNFAGQWLQLRNLELAPPDRETFPEFEDRLAADMRRETEMVFEHILHDNRSVLEFLDADYTFLNGRLARHYGLPAPAGDGFERVPLEGTARRGVVTHGSILTLTSLPTRTSPVKRGKWLLEQMLDVEPPPPPGNIPPLPESHREREVTLRALLEQHRASPSCAACHALLDPMGLALEHFDAIGRWRTRDGAHRIDASGRLITGQQFADWSELRRILVEDREQDFVRSFVKHLLTYAVGRGLTFRDKVAVEEILQRTAGTGFRFQDLILAVCKSVPFQKMRTGHWDDAISGTAAPAGPVPPRSATE